MRWFKDLYDRNVRLTDERLEHFENDHPEMAGQIDKIVETLSQPDCCRIEDGFRSGTFLSPLPDDSYW